LEIGCGGGTYVRSLGRDLAESLGTAAVMSALVRTSIGRFRLEEAIGPNELTNDHWPTYLQPPLRAVELLPQWHLSAEQTTRIRNGLTIELKGEGGSRKADNAIFAAPSDCEEIAALDPTGELIGVLGPMADGVWRAVRNLPTGE
jgi:tRNA pseudouridine55 synthase